MVRPEKVSQKWEELHDDTKRLNPPARVIQVIHSCWSRLIP